MQQMMDCGIGILRQKGVISAPVTTECWVMRSDEFPVDSKYWEGLIHPDDRENTLQKIQIASKAAVNNLKLNIG